MNDKEAVIEELKFLVNEGNLSDEQVIEDIRELSSEIAHHLRCEQHMGKTATLTPTDKVKRLPTKMQEVLYHLLDPQSSLSSYGDLSIADCNRIRLTHPTRQGLIDRKVVEWSFEASEWRINDLGVSVCYRNTAKE